VILADTSVWIDHLRSGDKQLHSLLNRGQALIHPFVTAELALGSLRERTNTLVLLDSLPQARVAHIGEVRYLIETRNLYTLGLGLVDAHLLSSVLISPGTILWTRDKPLRKLAEGFGIDAGLP
jgi:predicted nucleic acid-binding protein